VNDIAKGGPRHPPDSSLIAARADDSDRIPLAPGRPFAREMERPRTESYGKLWQRASVRMRRF
jgi:hypothetical protein